MQDLPELVIEPHRRPAHYWREIWQYRELFWFLSLRDLLVRYKQTLIGVAWSVLRPLATMLVFTLVFGRLARLPSEGVPYSVMVFAAMLPWQFFASSVTDSSQSLLANASLLTKVYFPRAIIPGSTLIVSLVDLLISLVLLLVYAAWQGVWPGWQIALLPLFLALCSALALGVGLGFAALNARYRDFRYVVPFFVQFTLYLSPVGFSSHIVPERWRALYALNPLVGIIDGFRWSLLGGRTALDIRSVVLAVGVTVSTLALSLWYFRSTERVLADVV